MNIDRLLLKEHKSVHLNLQLKEDEYSLIKQGFQPKSQNDKWNIYFENQFLFFERAKSNTLIYMLETIQVGSSYFLKDLWINADENENEHPDGINEDYEKKIVTYLIEKKLLNKQDVSFPYPDTINDLDKKIYFHGVVGEDENETIVKDTDKDFLDFDFNYRFDEIYFYFNYTDFIEDERSMYESAKESVKNKKTDNEDARYLIYIYELIRDYSKKINKWFDEHKFISGSVLNRYMIAGLYKNMKDTEKLKKDLHRLTKDQRKNFESLLDANQSENEFLIFYPRACFKKYYGKLLTSKNEYYNILGCSSATVITSEELFLYVIEGKKILPDV